MPKNRPLGWIIAVGAPNAFRPQMYATVADTVDHAIALVGDHLAITNEKVEFVKILIDDEVVRLGLKAGEVRRYA